MEIKAELLKPYTDSQRVEFIVEQNHRNGYQIEEMEDRLVAMGYTQEEIEQQEKECIARLSLTRADVERAIYKKKGMDFDDVVEYIKESEITGLDIKALKIEFKANNFYRGNKYVEEVGAILGFSSDDLDYLFRHGEFPTENEEIADEEIADEEIADEDTTN